MAKLIVEFLDDAAFDSLQRDARKAQVIWAGQRDHLLVYRAAIRRLRLAGETEKGLEHGREEP